MIGPWERTRPSLYAWWSPRGQQVVRKRKLNHPPLLRKENTTGKRFPWRRWGTNLTWSEVHGWFTCSSQTVPKTVGNFQNMQESSRFLPPHLFGSPYLTSTVLNTSKTTWTNKISPKRQSSKIREERKQKK